MVLILSAEQSQLHDEGGYPELRLLDDLIEQLDRDGITEEVIVHDDRGAVLFALTPAGGRPC